MAALTLTSADFTGGALSGGKATAPADLFSSTNFTLEVILANPSTTGTRVPLGQAGVFWIGFLSGVLIAKYGTGGTEVSLTSAVSMSDSVGRRVALSIGADGGYLFLEGALIASSATTAVASGITLPVATVLTIREGFASNATYNFLGTIKELSVWDSQKYTESYTPATPYVGDEEGLLHLWHLTSDGADSFGDSVALTAISSDDAAIIYSPGNWLVNSSYAKSINAGAYFKFIAAATVVKLNFDMTGISTPYSRIAIVVDGRTVQFATIASTVVVDLPTDQDNAKHLIEVIFDASTEVNNRWDSQATAVKLVSISIDATGAITPANVRQNTQLVYGDSIAEGVRTLAMTGANDLARNSALVCWPLELARLTNSEIGVIAFGGQGINDIGNGGVPILPNSYAYLWDSQARDFTDEPDICIWLMGANDGGSDTVSAGLTALNGMLTAMPTAKFVLFRPLLNTNQEANLQTIASTCNDPSRVKYVSTAGFWATADSSDNLHPYGYSCINDIAPKMANVINPILAGAVWSSELSDLTLSITGVPDGAEPIILVDANNVVIYEGSPTFTSGSTSLTDLPVAAGTRLYGHWKGDSAPSDGCGITGVTV